MAGEEALFMSSLVLILAISLRKRRSFVQRMRLMSQQKFPKSEAETRQSIQEFQDISHFPQVVGTLDVFHISFRAPKEDANEYVNRKTFHSIVLQGFAGANGKFMYVSIGYAGSIHDACVLRMSPLLPAIDILHSPTYRINGTEVKPLIVADKTYKLTTWCIKPFPQTRALTDSQRDFNKSLSSAGVVAGICRQVFGLLKGRWRCLLNKLDETVEKVSSTIIACCILHNICLEVNDPTEIDVVSDGNGFPRVLLACQAIILMRMVLR